jgi:septum formation protein
MRLPFPIVLASGSPRRKELLGKMVGAFTVEVSDVDEEALTVKDPWETAERLASAKAKAVADARVARRETGTIIIGGDTVVAVPIGGEMVQLSKPTSAEDSVRMLGLLSGRRHAVITGIAIYSPFCSLVASDTAWVTFRELSEAEIRDYVASGETMDKAGSYAIQGGAKGFVEKLEGDIETVVGFPTKVLRRMLRQVIESVPPGA